MTPLGNIVVLWGGLLLVANVIWDPIFQGMRTNLKNGKMTHQDINTTPMHFLIVGVIVLILASVIANANPKWAKTVLLAEGGMTVLWLISYNANKATTPNPPQQTTKGPNAKA